jgi:hypothetical protein
MSDPNRRVFPIVYSFEGHPSEDGSAFLVEATCFDDSVTRFAIPVDNIQHLIAFLLVWVGKISAAHPGAPPTCDDGGERLPIPATSVAIGEPSGEEAYIGISVGRAELVFSLPVSSLGSVGQSLLLAGAPINATAS